MFKPFPIDFKEYPYIDIKIWEWCPASCTDCRFNIDYIPKAKQFSLVNIKDRIKEVDKKFDKRLNLVFGNQNWLNHKDIISIIEYWINTWRSVRFQIDFNIKKNHILLLENIEKELWYENINIKIAQNCKWEKNILEKLIVLLKLLTSKTNFMIYLDLFIDFNENKKVIDYFYNKFWNKWSDYEYCFFIGKKINLKLQNYSWKLDRKNKCFVWLERERCQQLDQLKCDDDTVYLKDSIDVYDNWDMFLHDNLCNIWDIRISNLYLENNEIYNHFTKYLAHLEKLKNKHKSQSDMCYDCITNWFKYNKL